MATKVLQVFIFKGGDFVDTGVFSQPRVLIGRDNDSADLVLNSTHVSRRHAVFENDGSRVVVQDAGSKNGVYVNDEKVQRREVTRHDKITVGDFTLKIKMLDSEHEPTKTRVQHSDVVSGSTVEGSFANELTPPNISAVLPSPNQSNTSQTPVGMPRSGEYSAGDRDTRGSSNDAAGRRHVEHNHTRDLRQSDLGRTGDQPLLLDQTPGPSLRHLDPMLGEPPSTARGRGMQRRDARGRDDDDDDAQEHDDEDFSPPFSLAKTVLREQAGGRDTAPHVEVMGVVSDKVVDFELLPQGSGTWRRRPGIRHDPALGLGLRGLEVGSGECAVICDENIQGRLRRGHDTVEVSQVFSPGPTPGACHGTIHPGDLLNLSDGHRQYYLRYVNPPRVPADARSFWQKISLDGQLFNVAIASLVAHLIAAVLVTIMASGEEKPKPQEFVVTAKKDLELQEPPPPPPPPKPPEPEPPKPPEPPAKPKRPQKVAHRQPRQQKPTKAFVAPPNPGPPGILGLLSKKGATQAPGPVAAVQAVANLSAVKVPGNQGSYRVSGLIGKLPASAGISTGGGGGSLVTKGGAALLRGGGAARLADQGNRHVGGLVQKAPRAMRTAGQGSLDRALIEKVVNEHTDEIQRCYEKELLHDSSLQGKVQVEWIINLEGAVPSVRQVLSTVRSTALVTCIMNAVRTWKFPHPQGGPVVVNYPFILKGIDF